MCTGQWGSWAVEVCGLHSLGSVQPLRGAAAATAGHSPGDTARLPHLGVFTKHMTHGLESMDAFDKIEFPVVPGTR